MMLHIDGSRHKWFQDDRWYDLLVILDDATSQIYYAQLVEEESAVTVLRALREVVEQQRACELMVDVNDHPGFLRARHAPRAFRRASLGWGLWAETSALRPLRHSAIGRMIGTAKCADV